MNKESRRKLHESGKEKKALLDKVIEDEFNEIRKHRNLSYVLRLFMFSPTIFMILLMMWDVDYGMASLLAFTVIGCIFLIIFTYIGLIDS